MSAAITIRQLPDGAKQQLRMRAAAHGRSMEAEARDILLTALELGSRADLAWVEQLMSAGDAVGGIELELPSDGAADGADMSGL